MFVYWAQRAGSIAFNDDCLKKKSRNIHVAIKKKQKTLNSEKTKTSTRKEREFEMRTSEKVKEQVDNSEAMYENFTFKASTKQGCFHFSNINSFEGVSFATVFMTWLTLNQTHDAHIITGYHKKRLQNEIVSRSVSISNMRKGNIITSQV